MKKRIIGFILAISSVLCVGCNGNDTSYTITFIQEGHAEIVKTVKSGESLADIPLPQEKEGYDVAWDRENFDNVTSDLQVTAVLTPKNYTITYTYDELLINGGYTVVLEKQSQTVSFNSEYALATASCEGLSFLGWKNIETNEMVVSGTYTQAKDITLIAQFEPEDQEWS
ncbi:MAG: InlB B-repeat-containing protein [Clostridia bacterium]|nr:InlB B-repeat-containing protein [Clostridia bacterium]